MKVELIIAGIVFNTAEDEMDIYRAVFVAQILNAMFMAMGGTVMITGVQSKMNEKNFKVTEDS